jgi:hypothetical protein
MVPMIPITYINVKLTYRIVPELASSLFKPVKKLPVLRLPNPSATLKIPHRPSNSPPMIRTWIASGLSPVENIAKPAMTATPIATAIMPINPLESIAPNAKIFNVLDEEELTARLATAPPARYTLFCKKAEAQYIGAGIVLGQVVMIRHALFIVQVTVPLVGKTPPEKHGTVLELQVYVGPVPEPVAHELALQIATGGAPLVVRLPLWKIRESAMTKRGKPISPMLSPKC